MQKSSLLALTRTAVTAIAAGRFVDNDGNHAADGEKPLGVSAYAGAVGADVSVDVLGTTILETAGAIASMGPIKPAADGSGKGIAQGGAGPIGAYALQPAAGAGEFIEVLLVP